MSVILLNADYSYLNRVSWQKAVTLLCKGKAEVLKYSDKVVRNFDRSVVMKIPLVMRLIKFIRTLYKTKVPFSKRNILTRDEHTCAYCGKQSKRLTIDHIVPKSKGGKTTWENTVACCKECNSKKGDKNCREVKMFPHKQPRQPTIYEFMLLKLKHLGIDELLRDLGVY